LSKIQRDKTYEWLDAGNQFVFLHEKVQTFKAFYFQRVDLGKI